MKTLHTLVVDDNEINCQVALGLLARLGHSGEAASSGEEALELFEVDKYDLILMDCHMPGIDGFETTMAIREREALQGNLRVPIIAVTADAEGKSRERCFAAGMDDFLAKPISTTRFRQALEKVAHSALDFRDEPLLDARLLNELRNLGVPGGPNPLPAIVDLFLAETPPLLRKFNEAVLARDQKAIAEIGRRLEGSCLSFGARRVMRLCSEIQTAISQDVSPQFFVVSLNQEFTRMVSSLHQIRDEALARDLIHA